MERTQGLLDAIPNDFATRYQPHLNHPTHFAELMQRLQKQAPHYLSMVINEYPDIFSLIDRPYPIDIVHLFLYDNSLLTSKRMSLLEPSQFMKKSLLQMAKEVTDSHMLYMSLEWIESCYKILDQCSMFNDDSGFIISIIRKILECILVDYPQPDILYYFVHLLEPCHSLYKLIFEESKFLKISTTLLYFSSKKQRNRLLFEPSAGFLSLRQICLQDVLSHHSTSQDLYYSLSMIYFTFNTISFESDGLLQVLVDCTSIDSEPVIAVSIAILVKLAVQEPELCRSYITDSSLMMFVVLMIRLLELKQATVVYYKYLGWTMKLINCHFSMLVKELPRLQELLGNLQYLGLEMMRLCPFENGSKLASGLDKSSILHVKDLTEKENSKKEFFHYWKKSHECIMHEFRYAGICFFLSTFTITLPFKCISDFPLYSLINIAKFSNKIEVSDIYHLINRLWEFKMPIVNVQSGAVNLACKRVLVEFVCPTIKRLLSTIEISEDLLGIGASIDVFLQLKRCSQGSLVCQLFDDFIWSFLPFLNMNGSSGIRLEAHSAFLAFLEFINTGVSNSLVDSILLCKLNAESPIFSQQTVESPTMTKIRSYTEEKMNQLKSSFMDDVFHSKEALWRELLEAKDHQVENLMSDILILRKESHEKEESLKWFEMECRDYQSKIIELEKNIFNETSAVQSASKTIEDLHVKNIDLECQYATLESKHLSLESTCLSLQQSLSECEHQGSRLKEASLGLKSHIQCLDETVQAKENEMMILQVTLTESTIRIVELTESLDQIHSALNECKSTLEYTEAELVESNEHVKDFEVLIAEKEYLIASLTEDQDHFTRTLREEMNSVQTQNNHLQLKLYEALTELNILRNDYENQSQEYTYARKEIEEKQYKIILLEKELDHQKEITSVLHDLANRLKM